MNSLRWLQLVWCSNFIKFRCCQWWLHQDYYNENCNNWIWSWQEKQKSYYQFHNILIDVSIMRTNIILGFDEVDILFYLRLNFFSFSWWHLSSSFESLMAHWHEATLFEKPNWKKISYCRSIVKLMNLLCMILLVIIRGTYLRYLYCPPKLLEIHSK